MHRHHEPNYEAALMLVRHLDNDALKALVNDDDGVADLVKNVEQCREMETEKELIMTQNKSLAEYNLSLAPRLEQEKSKLKDLYDSVQSVWNNVQEKQAEISKSQEFEESSTGNLNGETALALLQTAAAESEEESENIADKFYQKQIDMDEFLEQFETVRIQMHLRRVKADKMKDLLLKKHNNSNANGPYPKLPPSVPYPVGAINMPYFPMAQ